MLVICETESSQSKGGDAECSFTDVVIFQSSDRPTIENHREFSPCFFDFNLSRAAVLGVARARLGELKIASIAFVDFDGAIRAGDDQIIEAGRFAIAVEQTGAGILVHSGGDHFNLGTALVAAVLENRRVEIPDIAGVALLVFQPIHAFLGRPGPPIDIS